MQNPTFTNVDTEIIKTAVSEINSEIDILNNVEKYLSNNIPSDLAPYWQGAAKNNFTEQLIAFMETYKKYIANLTDINAELQVAAVRYENADNNVRQLIAQLAK